MLTTTPLNSRSAPVAASFLLSVALSFSQPALAEKPAAACAQPHELPVVTHWSEASSEGNTPGFSLGASDQFTQLIPTPLWGSYRKGSCYYAGNINFLPQPGEYPADRYSIKRISNARVLRYTDAACARNGVAVRFFRPDSQPQLIERLADQPKNGGGVVQALHGLIIDGAMVSIFLPPNWRANAGEIYPVIASSTYDLNATVFSKGGEIALNAVSRSGADGNKGFIGILWNGGASVASRTVHLRSREQFNAIINYAAETYGADRSNVILYGGSRGAMAALMAASNPDPHQYRVRYVYAAVPGVKLGSHIMISPLTLPGLMKSFDYTVMLSDAWRNGWVYPECGKKTPLWGQSNQAAVLNILTSHSDPQEVDLEHSPISPRFIAALKKAGTEVYLDIGTHDNIIPFAHEAEYVRTLRAEKIPVEVSIFVRSGHKTPLPKDWYWNRIWPVVQKMMVEGRDTSALPVHFVNNGAINHYRINRYTEKMEAFVPDEGVFPFTLEVPSHSFVGMATELIVSADPGTSYQFTITDPHGAPRKLEGVLNASGYQMIGLGVATSDQIGIHTYSGLKIRRGTGDWKTLDLQQTTSRDRTALYSEVFAKIPFLGGLAMSEAVSFQRRVTGANSTSWGVSEW
jgi:predicted esterase